MQGIGNLQGNFVKGISSPTGGATATSLPRGDAPALERLVDSLNMRLVGLSNTVADLEAIADRFAPCDAAKSMGCNGAPGLYGQIEGMQDMVSAIEARIRGVIGRL